VLGAAPGVEATIRSKKRAAAAARENIKLTSKSDVPNDAKTQKGKEHFGEESNVTENLLAALQKQKTCRRKNRLFRLPPLTRQFCTAQRARNGSNS
jgi:hypothetical protein